MSFISDLFAYKGIENATKDYASLPILRFVEDNHTRLWTGADHCKESFNKMKKFAKFADFGERPLRDYTSLHLYAFRDYLQYSDYNTKSGAYGLSASTANNYISCFGKVFNIATKMDIIDKKPFVEKLPTNSSRKRVFSKEEQVACLEFFKRSKWPWMGQYLEIALTTGMRKAEILGINQTKDSLPSDYKTFGKLSVGGNYVVLNATKNSGVREVPLPPRAQKALKALNNKPLDHYKTHVFYEAWRECRRAVCKIDPEFVFHVSRHTFASTMANKPVNMNLAVLSEILGHRSVQTTKSYVHGDRDEKMAAMTIA